MSAEHLATYLNDHLAGSVVALELLEHLEEDQADTPLAGFFAQLRIEITEDRDELEALMKRLDVSESRTRKASAWLTEKVTALKLRLDDPSGGDLRLFESLEALSLGIEGKRGLWQALASTSDHSSALQSLDYSRLLQRADDQRQRVEAKRLEVAARTLNPGS